MARSVWKPPFSKAILFQEIFLKYKQKKIITLLSKDLLIFPIFVGHNFLIYNGKKFVKIQIHDFMIGRKFGCFITTKKNSHNG